MMDLIYMVLYTHQKTKKAKTWQDGTLKVLATGTKAVLYDDKGSKLDVLHVHASDVVTGEQLESDRSAAVGFGVSSGGDHSQALSDVDFSQVDHQTDLKEEENEDFPDSLTDWCGSDVGEKGIAEVIQEQGSNLTSNKANLSLGCNTGSVSKTPNQENRDVLAEGYSQGERCPQFSGGSEQLSGDAQCAETAVGDTEACFELSFSPLSGVGDSDGETWPEHDGGKSCSQETQFSLKTTVSVEQQLTTGTDQHLSPEHVSQMFEDVPDPVDSHPNHDLNHPVDSVEVCQNTDTVHVQKTSSVDDPLMRGDMVNASETRKGDCASQFATQGSSWNSESCVKKGSPVSHSDNVKVDQTLQMEQGKFPETSNTDTVCIKSLNAGSYGIPRNTSDPMRTVNDLHLSPDSYVPTESSHQSPEMPAGDNMAVNRLYQGCHEEDDNRENIQSSCDTYAEEEHNPLWSQSQSDTQESKSGITAESLQKQVEAVVSELSMPSSPLSCVSVSTPDQQPMLNVQNSRFDCCVHVQDSSAGLFRSAKPVSGWTNSEMGKAVNTSHLHQKCGCAQNMQCDCDLDHHHYTKDSPLPTSEALPEHRPFQTVREVLGDKRTTAQQAPFCSLRGKGADSVLQGSVIEDKSQADSLVESLTSDSADMESPHISQPVSSPLPHPEQLLKGSALDIAIPASSSEVTAPDIAQSISARLTDYKMHGMLASDVVQRPMAYRRRVVDHQHNSLPLVNSPTALVTQGICSSRNKGLLDPLINSPTALVTQGICNSRNKGLLDLSPSREAVDQSVSCTGASCFQVHTSGSAWTPESRLFSPADGVTLLQMSSQCLKTGGGTTSARHSRNSPTQKSSCPVAVPLTRDMSQQQNSPRLFVSTDCRADGEKRDEILKDNGDQEESGGVFVNGNLQTIPDFNMKEKSVAVSRNNPVFGNSTCRIGEDSTVSPVLFSQFVQSQGQAATVSRTQRSRRLVPVVTAPEELAANESLQSARGNEVEDTMSLKSTGIGHKTAIPSQQERPVNSLDPFSLQTNSSDSLAVCDDRHSPMNFSREVEDQLLHSHVENLDFSGFMDSFPETDQVEDLELDTDSVTTLSKCTKAESHAQDDEAWKQKEEDVKADCTAHLVFDSGESTSRTDPQKVRQTSSRVGQCSESMVSSPRFLIANTGLDCIEEMEQDSPAADDDKDQSQRSPAEQESFDNIQKQNKITKFAHRFRTLHPYVGKENQARLTKGKPMKAYGTGSGCYQKSFEKGASFGHEILAPSDPTDSPPLDITPERGVEKSSQLRNTHSASHMGAETSQPGQTGFEFHQTRLPEETAQTHCSPYIKSKQLRHPTTHFEPETIQPTQTGFRPARLPEETAQAQAPGPAVGTGCVSGPVRKVGLGKFQRPGVSTAGGCLPGSQSSLCHELQFCSREEVERQATPVRQVVIPPSFQSLVSYKQILTAALTEFINIQLFTVAKTFHCALSKVDLTAYIEGTGAMGNLAGGSTNPACKCGSASKVALVKKEGPNKGRFFYACSAPRDKQCKFFQWVDQQSGSSSSKGSGTSMVRPKFSDPASITGYFRGQGLAVYCQCQFVRRADNHNFKFGFPMFKLFLLFMVDDLWVVSKSLSFAKGETFVARSTFHGPNTHGEVAVDPVAGYSASLWTDGSVCHAVHCGNAGTELTCLTNIQDHVDMTSLPLLPHLLSPQPCSVTTSRMASKGFKAPTAMQSPGKLHIPPQFVHDLAADFVGKYQLNNDQAEAVRRVATMMDKEADPASSLLLIHGVFGAGKSFLLSVVILFLVEVFQRNDAYCPGVPFPWKLLLSSTTNVAVDRVLQGLLELGFDDFVRVGSAKKIAKPVLPYSMHASGSDNHELRDLQEMLKSTDITSAEKHCIRKSIERHRLGENRKRLGAVRVVGVTCAACSFQCLDKMQFPFVVLDECSQMTEPSSLLPIARSACEKLMLVGDPKQLDPTLQGSEAAHREGLEQTLFDRLMKMGQDPVMLRTQYRCHPAISAVANTLFYHGHLLDGVTPHHRQPILDLFPTMCFYDVSGGEETTDSSGSFTNEAEAQFVALLLSVLMVRGLQPASVGVITLYRAQARHILNIIRQSKGDAQRAMAGVQVSTVDAFQGAERDIIILSCVRTRSVGFIDSDKRMNVALTRARHHMLIVGHQKNLHANRRWAEVISHCQAFAGGVVAASAASRQLQTVLDQTSEDQDYTTADSSAEGPHQAQHAGARKRKSPPQKDGQSGQVSLPAATQTVISSNPLEPMDAAHSSSDQMESSLTGRVVMNQEPAMPENTSPEGPNRGADCSPVENRRSRVKPLVIDEQEEDQSDSDDDFLPGGLF
ncbi:hypothetical protein ACOMHN_052705 [Nucella lapillus]